MAHCINCDVLISDRPEHGDFCSPECAAEYTSGADPTRLAAADIAKLTNASNTSITVNSEVNTSEANSTLDNTSKKS